MSTRKKTTIQPARLLGLRQAKTRFRFDKNRDDQHPGPKTAYIFATQSPILDGSRTDCGVYGAPCGVLFGYERTETPNGIQSVHLAENSFIHGRLVEMSFDEIARLDAVAELVMDGHRFLAEIKSPQTGYTFAAWVYQANADKTPVEDETSAVRIDNKTLQLSGAR